MNVTEPDGILLIDKPQGITSHDAVYAVRRLLRTKKVGHTGTLDPDASGLLVVLAGRAAKAAEYLSSDVKEYSAVMRLCVATDTQDMTGKILSECENVPDEAAVIKAADSFKGEYLQTPPMYSALKQNGRKLVDLARKGIEVPREPRAVSIYGINCEKLGDTLYRLGVKCSKGTYIRTLCDDIGKKLGCGAAMQSLRRLSSGAYSVSDAITLEECEKLGAEGASKRLLPAETLFSDLPKVQLQGFFLKLCKSGAEIYQHKINTDYPAGQRVRLYDGDGFFALGEVRDFEDGTAIKPVKTFRL